MKRTKKDRENAGKYGICLACGAGRTIMLTLDESGTFELQISCPKGHPQQ